MTQGIVLAYQTEGKQLQFFHNSSIKKLFERAAYSIPELNVQLDQMKEDQMECEIEKVDFINSQAFMDQKLFIKKNDTSN